MLVDGAHIAREIRERLQKHIAGAGLQPSLGVVIPNETPEIRMFVELKRRFGEAIGVTVGVHTIDTLSRNNQALLGLVLDLSKQYDGLIVQLPLPKNLDLDSLLHLLPLSHDVDVIGHVAYQQFKEGRLPFFPPVVAAMDEIVRREGVRLSGAHVLVAGEGRLVGAPAAVWAKSKGAVVKVVNKQTSRFNEWARGADVILSGAGAPGIFRPDNIKEGVVIFDAGTSEQGGVLKGDADPMCAEKARVFTPTPGGIGPITVAKVFENLLTLQALKARQGYKPV